ncbi:MAG: hypothetical protein ACKOX6_16835 [Bdellovibrio sp.]
MGLFKDALMDDQAECVHVCESTHKIRTGRRAPATDEDDENSGVEWVCLTCGCAWIE